MQKVIFQAILGLTLSSSGILLAFFSLGNTTKGTNPLLLTVIVVLILAGASLLFWAGKSDATLLHKSNLDKTESDTSPKVEGLASRLKKNNAIMSEWTKTENTRNRLKMLELSAAADEKGKKV